MGFLPELRKKDEEGGKIVAYKELSDSYLMSMTKRQIIERLRMAEHNFQTIEEAVHQQYDYTKDWHPVRRGTWIHDKKNRKAKCSECGKLRDCRSDLVYDLLCEYEHYCYNCGANMSEEET